MKTLTSKELFNVDTDHTYTFKLPWPPSINNYYGRTRTGSVYIKKPGRDFRDIVKDALRIIKEDYEPLRDRLQVWIEAYPPDRRRRDLDNIKKALLDAMTHAGVYEDDCLIDDLRVIRAKNEEKYGFVRVHVAKIKSE